THQNPTRNPQRRPGKPLPQTEPRATTTPTTTPHTDSRWENRAPRTKTGPRTAWPASTQIPGAKPEPHTPKPHREIFGRVRRRSLTERRASEPAKPETGVRPRPSGRWVTAPQLAGGGTCPGGQRVRPPGPRLG